MTPIDLGMARTGETGQPEPLRVKSEWNRRSCEWRAVMQHQWRVLSGCGFCMAILFSGIVLIGADVPRTGPESEKRFPPLKLPPGFKATLFACDPMVEYPSAVAAGPRAGSIFVAVDSLSGLGAKSGRLDEIRIVRDVDGDGYADQASVYARGFNSIQGLAFHDGALFVMHAPFLTALRDRDGDGVAEVRRDLLQGLGLPPDQNPPLLHCANGVTVGHDGWLYLALGDHGCDVQRPEGDRLVLEGGGILRCRGDGRDLHVFATGLRNIYDVALDEEQNAFVRDNENDGGDYLVRIAHSFLGADHGYPYLYAEHPDEALAPLAVVGLGSSAGGLCYLETGFPAEYRGNLFFCEWGRAVMRVPPGAPGVCLRAGQTSRIRLKWRQRLLCLQADRPGRPARGLADRDRLGRRSDPEAGARSGLSHRGV